MKKFSAGILAIAALTATLIAPSKAADLDGSTTGSAAMCLALSRSPILDLASVADMEREVDRRYQHALQVSLADSTIASRSPRFVWSNEAKFACGKSVGYFAGREINEEMVSKCDCYHARMTHYLK